MFQGGYCPSPLTVMQKVSGVLPSVYVCGGGGLCPRSFDFTGQVTLALPLCREHCVWGRHDGKRVESCPPFARR